MSLWYYCDRGVDRGFVYRGREHSQLMKKCLVDVKCEIGNVFLGFTYSLHKVLVTNIIKDIWINRGKSLHIQ